MQKHGPWNRNLLATSAPQDQTAVLDEIHLLIAESAQERDVVHPDVVAAYIADAYPQNEFGVGVISARIIVGALAVGLPVEIGSTDGGTVRLALPQPLHRNPSSAL